MPASCSDSQIIAGLFEQAENITDITDEKIKESPNYALRMVPDGGVVRRNQNTDSVIYGQAFQAPIAYKSANHDVRPLEAGGEFPGADLSRKNSLFTNEKNEMDDNACNGLTEINFSQGFRVRGGADFKLPLTTPVRCVREFDRFGAPQIRSFFNAMKDQFSMFGMTNYADNLLNLMIQNSDANASIREANQFRVSSGGWEAPPTRRLTIHFLQDYRRYMMREMKGFGLEVSEDYKLDIEAPVEDWIDAINEDQLQRNLTGTVYNNEQFTDTEGKLRGRKFAEYGGIRCYFNDTPIRGYFAQHGTSGGAPIFRFVRVLDRINVVDEEAGLVARANHQYDRDTIVVGGISYPMVTLIPHIDPRSFKRHGLVAPIKPIGTANAGVNYQVNVLDGSYIDCNPFNDKFQIVARHEFRFRTIRPEISGFIAYRHAQRAGYVLSVTPRNYGPEVVASTAASEQFRIPTDDSGCVGAECAECDQVVGDDDQCIDAAAASVAVVGLIPAGAVNLAFFGVATNLRLAVERSVSGEGPVTVAFTTANGTATAGADYTTTAGTLEWAAGDLDQKFINVPVLAAATNGETFTVTLSAPSGATLKTGAVVTTATIVNLA
jgi:hypothetical protein